MTGPRCIAETTRIEKDGESKDQGEGIDNKASNQAILSERKDGLNVSALKVGAGDFGLDGNRDHLRYGR